MTNVALGADALLASLFAQAEGRGVDLVTLRALAEESSQAGARRALASLGLDDERARRDSFAQRASEGEIVNLSADPGTMLEGAAPVRNSPLAMNVSGNIPIVIKDKTAEAAKSLKCGECGAMNYPTEWYCERCGAELASL